LTPGYQLNLRGPNGPIGSLVVSTTTPRSYIVDVHRLTGRGVALLGAGGAIASNLRIGGASLPASGHTADVQIAGRKLRAGTTTLPGPGAPRLALFGPTESGGFFASSP